MRRSLLTLAIFCGIALVGAPSSAQAQFGNNFADPFSFYYGYFIPSQIYQSSIPKAEDTVRMYSAQRQVNALTERAGLFDPIGSTGTDPFDMFGDTAGRGGAGGRPRVGNLPRTNRTGPVNTHINGSGPMGYYNRDPYHPNLRLGRGANRSIQPIRGGRGGGMGGMGMPSMGGMGGMGGMR